MAPNFTVPVGMTMNVGSTFDPMKNISATDKEDGDLTNKITIEGQVDTSKVGVYGFSLTSGIMRNVEKMIIMLFFVDLCRFCCYIDNNKERVNTPLSSMMSEFLVFCDLFIFCAVEVFVFSTLSLFYLL